MNLQILTIILQYLLYDIYLVFILWLPIHTDFIICELHT